MYPLLLTPDEVAALIGLSRPVVLQMAKRGELPPPVSINARVLRFRAEDLATRFGLDPARLAQQINQGSQQ